MRVLDQERSNRKGREEYMSDTATQSILQRVQTAKLTRDFAMATRLLRQGLEKYPDDVDLWKELGTCYVKSGNDKRAIDPFNQVLKLEPAEVDALNELGGIYRRLGEYDRSIAVLEQGLMTASDTLQINYNLGHTYKLAGRYDAAEECFNTVLEMNPRDVLAINHLGCIQALRGDHEKALMTYRRALQVDPNHPILHLNSARSYQALGKESEAKAAYENALKSKPGWKDAMNGYAELLMHSKDLGKCDSILEQALKINPESPELHSSKGNLNVRQGKYIDAENSYNTALDFDDENMNALNGVEQLYEKQGRNNDALKKIQRMVDLAPENLEYELRYSKLLINQKRLEEAGEKLKSLYQDNLDNTSYLNTLAQYFIRSGHVEKANGCFQRIAELEPGNVTYMRDAASQFYLNQQYDEAAESLDHYLQRKPNDPIALALRGDVYDKKDDPENALRSWKKALEFDENNPMILASVQRVGNENGEQTEIAALMTDILTDNINNGDSESIRQSMEMYENNISLFADEPAELSAPDPHLQDLGEEIESVETLDYSQLLQFEPETDEPEVDPYDSLTLDVPPEEFLRPIDEEVYSKKLQGDLPDHRLIDDDMPVEYDANRDGSFEYDPYIGTSQQGYDPDEEDSLMNVQGSGFEEELMDESTGEPTQYQAVGEPLSEPVSARTSPEPAGQPAEPAPAVKPAAAEPAETEPADEPVAAIPAEKAPAYDVPPAETMPEFEPEIEPVTEAATDIATDTGSAGEPEAEDDIFEEESNMIPVENSDNDILSFDDDEQFPGDRDTSEDEIPTVDDLISVPVEEDELHELDEVPTISDLIGDAVDSLNEEPAPEEETEEVPSIEDLLNELSEPAAEEEPVIEEEPMTDEEPVVEEEPTTFGDNDDGSETLSLDELANITNFVSDNPDPEIRTVETVGNVLKDVVFKSEERPVFKSVADMFNDLRELTQWLPEEKHTVFIHSLDRLKLDYVIARLNGRPGLLAAASAVRETGGIIPEPPKEKPSLLKTMEYLRTLAGQVPDKSQAEAMTSQMGQVVSYLSKDTTLSEKVDN